MGSASSNFNHTIVDLTGNDNANAFASGNVNHTTMDLTGADDTGVIDGSSPSDANGNSSTATTATDDAPHKIFRFLDLPPELRIMIYELALTPRDRRGVPGASIRSKHKDKLRERWKAPRRIFTTLKKLEELTPQLLVVCKQVNAEATTYLYRQPLKFRCWDSVTDFLEERLLSQRYIEHIVCEEFWMPSASGATYEELRFLTKLRVFGALWYLTSLRHLHIHKINCGHVYRYSTGSTVPLEREMASRKGFELLDVLGEVSKKMKREEGKKSVDDLQKRLRDLMVEHKLTFDGQRTLEQ